MPIRIGNKRNLFPKNRKAVEIAQNRLEQITPMAQEQYDNVLQVNGYDCIIYNKLTSGRKCSCSLGKKHSPTILDEEGNATKEHIQSILTGSNFGVNDYNNHAEDDIDSGDILELDSTQGIKDENQNTIDEDVYADTTTLNDADIDDDFIFEQDLSNDFSSRCAVCYGNGFVGGFSVFNGIRMVLDTTFIELPESFKRSSSVWNTTVHKMTTPYVFELHDTDAYVEFEIVIPKNIIGVDTIAVRNNFEFCQEAKLQIRTDAQPTFTNLTTTNILSYATGLPCRIRVSGVSQFTHLEMQFNCSDTATFIEYPRLTKTGDLTLMDAIDQVSLIASPKVTSLQPWDYIADNVFGKIWRVTNSNYFNDRNLNNHGWDIQARVVQPYEMQSTLTFRKSVKRKTTNFNR